MELVVTLLIFALFAEGKVQMRNRKVAAVRLLVVNNPVAQS
jgi:hypothetical protein